MDEKQLLRERLIAARKAHHRANGDQAAIRLASHHRALPLEQTEQKSHIGVYLPMGSEMDIRPLSEALRQAGHTLCLPVCEARDAAVVFRHYAPDTPLVPDAMGIDAPHAEAASCRPDMILLPLLGFDKTGQRLGRGGGYYDRTLAALRASGPIVCCGIAYDMQMVDKCPSAPHDQALDMVLTEAGLTQFERKQ